MTTNTENIENTQRVIEYLDAVIQITQVWSKKADLLAARDHCIEAQRALREDDNDTAGRHLERASKLIMEARA